MTVLEEACKSKDGLVKWLLEHGADIKAANAQNPGYHSMIMMACEAGNMVFFLGI